MRREEEGIFIALFGGPFFAIGDQPGVLFQAQIVLLDLACRILIGIAEQQSRKAARERGLAHSLRSRKKHGLRDALPPEHIFQNLGDGAMPEEVFQQPKLTRFRGANSHFSYAVDDVAHVTAPEYL